MCLNKKTMIFSNIKQFFTKNRKIFYYIWFFIFIFSFSYDATFAELDANLPLYSKNNVVEVINMVIQVIGVLMGVATYLATMFLSPEWINGSLFWLDEKLKGIWILVSNIVYFIFAFILIWVAFMNIIWKTWETYQLKQALPKFIVWVLIVPFSWFLVQFILSISAILTVSAITLPYETFDDYWVKMSEMKIPKDCKINLNKNKAKDEQIIDCTFDKLEWDKMTDSILWIFSLYTYWILKFDSYDDFSKKFMEESKAGTMLDLVVKMLFSFIFIIVYWVLIITLALVLLIRWIYIWIYIMLSPAFWLMYFFWKTDWWEWLVEKFNLKEFIALALIPVYTMLALSFGLLFIFIIWQWLVTSSSLEGNIALGKIDSDTKLAKNWDSYLRIGERRLIISWAFSDVTASDLTSFTNTIEKEWGWLLWVVWNLILKIFGIVVLWGAVMAAMRTSKITRQITEPLYNFWTKVWEIAASAPANIPIFWWQSMKSMGTVASWIEWKISQMSTDRGNRFLDKTPFGNNTLTKSMGDLQNDIITATSQSQKAALMQKILKNTDWDFKQLYTSPAAQKALFNLISKIKPEILKDLKIDKPSDINNWTLVAKIYEKVEDEGLAYKDILPENNWKINEAAMIEAAKRLKNTSISTPTDSTNDNNWITQTPHWTTNISFNLPWRGNWSILWKIWKDGIEWFRNVDYEQLAKYIHNNSMSEEGFKNLLNELTVDPSKTSVIQKEISKYIKKDWDNYSYVSTWWQGDSNLKSFLTKNNPK